MQVKSSCRGRRTGILSPWREIICSTTLLVVLLGLTAVGHPVRAATPPVLLDYQFHSADTLSDGRPRLVKDDTVELLTHWTVPDSAELANDLHVTADFSRLDPGVPGNHAWPAVNEGGGRYRVIYALSHRVSRPDSNGIRIPLLAVGPTGNADDRRVEVCLSNQPPVHVNSHVIQERDAYRSGDSLVIETIWTAPQGLPLQITASFAEVDTSGPVVRGTDHGGVFLIRYRLPLSQDQMPADGSYPIPITARDAGCGQTTVDTLLIVTDTEPPAVEFFRIDPLPAVTTAESLLVSGEAPGAVVVSLIRNKLPQERAEAEALTGRFSGMLELLPGENRIQIRGEDEAGNPTLPYPTNPSAVIVTRVEATQLEVGTPYSRKDKSGESTDDISVMNPEPMDGAVVRIFNLEGDCLWEERPSVTGPLRDFRFHWEGTDRAGDRAPQGYYLVRAEWRDPGGKAHSITKGLLLRD